MEEFDYPSIRVMLEATLDRMRQPIKIDISTDDVITPKAVEYDYKLMFEDRTMSVLTYNKETLLAELWGQFQKSNFYVGDLEWKSVIDYVENTMKKYLM